MPDVRICPNCRHQNRSEARFCSACGKTLTGVPLTTSQDTSPSPRPKIEGMRWRMRPGEVAARIESDDMPAQNNQLIVEENILALLLENGAVVSQRGPGTHTVQSFEDHWFRRRPEHTAILLDSGEIPV